MTAQLCARIGKQVKMEIDPHKGMRFQHSRKQIQDGDGRWIPAQLVVTAIRHSTVFYGVEPTKGLWSCSIELFAQHVEEVL